MKFILLLSLAVLCLYFEETNAECEPGQSFMQSCNYCTCTPDGQHAACTLMACPGDVVDARKTKSKREDVNDKSTCTPGESFPVGCNQCTCSTEDHKATCTTKVCA